MASGGRNSGDPFFTWRPLPDPGRPDFPYHHGLNLSIHPHRPPPPFGITGYYKGSERQQSAPGPLRQSTQSDWCLQYPPANPSPDFDSSEVVQLHVIDEIACEDGRGPQLVRCCLDQDDGKIYAAKIYDPFYYSYADREFGTPVDVTWLADQHYSRECAAYKELSEAKVDGLLVPKYYGSWTFNMVLRHSHDVRPVRMILMECISGFSMQSLIDSQKFNYSPEQRLAIFARAMEVECRINFHGVRHGDFAPRNIILEYTSASLENSRVLLVDFNYSATFSQPNCRYKSHETTRPISPRYRFWGPCPNEFLSWVPQPHCSRPAAFMGWLKSLWEDSEEFAGRGEGTVRLLDYDEPVEVVGPEPDVHPMPTPSTLPLFSKAKDQDTLHSTSLESQPCEIGSLPIFTRRGSKDIEVRDT